VIFNPIRHQPYEVFLMRLSLGILFLWYGLPKIQSIVGQPAPVGLGKFVDFTFLCNPRTALALKVGVVLALILYTFGRFLPLVLPYMLFVALAFGTLYNSQGAIGHSYQPLSLVLLVQCALALWAVAARHAHPGALPEDKATYFNREIHCTKQAIVAVYVTSAITKLIESKGAWLFDLPSIAVDLQKTQEQYFYDHLTPLPHSLTDVVIQHPNLAYLIFAPGLFLETFAFLALFGRKWALVMGLALVTMHYLIAAVMGLSFKVLAGLVVIYLINIPYWFVWIWKRRPVLIGGQLVSSKVP